MGTTRPGPVRFALIIGAMKAGTTSLFEYLAGHPAVAPSRPKEPNFFIDREMWGPDSSGSSALVHYRALWDWDPATHEVALEASTSYTQLPVHPGVPGRVKSLGDLEFQFVYLMRDPVRRMVSHLSHLATRRGGADRVDDADFDTAVQVSRYAMQLDAWTAHWDREVILPLVYEEMAENPVATVANVGSFLGLRPLDRDAGLRAHNTRTEMAADQVLSDVLNRVPWLERVGRRVPDRVLGAVRVAAGRWGTHEFELTLAQEERAVEVLLPEARRIRDEWDVDTSLWESVS